MSDSNDYWQRVVDGLKGRGFRFRIKWNGEDELAPWQTWVICPVPGYLESGCGPVSVRDVEWLGIATTDREGADQRSDVIAALKSIKVQFRDTPDSIQVVLEVI